MSVYEWERGTLRIPSDQWVALRKGIIKFYNGHMTTRYQLAVLVHSKVSAATKGKRGSKRVAARGDAMEKALEGVKYDDRWPVEHALVHEGKLRRPQKKDFPLLPFSKGATLECGELSVDLDDKTKSLAWEVEENNHARDAAHSSWLGSFVLRKLRGIDWKRSSGGKFIGNDEINRDEGGDEEGGGGSYVTMRFGPLGKSEKGY